jgi:hypothetical protein
MMRAASAGSSPFADAITMIGLAGGLSWLAWRFGPVLLRIAGFCSLWVAWACGSQGGYAYCGAFLALGTLVWGAGTLWYAKRHGRWPSPLSGRLLTRVLGRHNPVPQDRAATIAVLPRQDH